MDFIAFRRVRIVVVATALGALSFISFDPVPHAARAQEPRGIRSLIYFGVGEALPIVDWMDAVLLNADAADSTNADQL